MIEFVIVFLVFYHTIINFASGYIFHSMKTTKEYILLISSKAEELKRDFGIKSLRIFGSVSRISFFQSSFYFPALIYKSVQPCGNLFYLSSIAWTGQLFIASFADDTSSASTS